MAIALALLLTPAAAVARPADLPAQEPVSVPVYGYEVVRVWPHDRTAFTQGLAWHEGDLLESTGRYPSTVRRVRLEDGAVLDRRVLDIEWFGEGLTEIDGRIFTLTWQNGRGFIWDAADLGPRGDFTYNGEGWGLTDDGRRLILSDGTPALRFLDAETQAETGRVPVTLDGRPLGQINELEWVDGEVFANIWRSDVIVRIDPATGRVTGVIDLTGLLPDRRGMDPGDDVLNGIAWDPENRRLFVTGKNWPSLFEIRLTGPL
ncbi:glutaminyl-peptide cyclotransferase [Roseibacterium beibuensis]|uniref:glutaminyl-peptide cyclotransferase n=1 Tax=[Roseibacterium] beibuensis TaxID=1193142 RepID=UPI00217E9A8C|nr:glutaminyl-peptide cyclotransferase [Roseibacterium beibuensis]MCS6624572.1 glutaminyl-peptide cyclotransferase [Roseibacterium beibuensis]